MSQKPHSLGQNELITSLIQKEESNDVAQLLGSLSQTRISQTIKIKKTKHLQKKTKNKPLTITSPGREALKIY